MEHTDHPAPAAPAPLVLRPLLTRRPTDAVEWGLATIGATVLYGAAASFATAGIWVATHLG